jgi:hypothetical protein
MSAKKYIVRIVTGRRVLPASGASNDVLLVQREIEPRAEILPRDGLIGSNEARHLGPCCGLRSPQEILARSLPDRPLDLRCITAVFQSCRWTR